MLILRWPCFHNPAVSVSKIQDQRHLEDAGDVDEERKKFTFTVAVPAFVYSSPGIQTILDQVHEDSQGPLTIQALPGHDGLTSNVQPGHNVAGQDSVMDRRDSRPAEFDVPDIMPERAEAAKTLKSIVGEASDADVAADATGPVQQFPSGASQARRSGTSNVPNAESPRHSKATEPAYVKMQWTLELPDHELRLGSLVQDPHAADGVMQVCDALVEDDLQKLRMHLVDILGLLRPDKDPDQFRCVSGSFLHATYMRCCRGGYGCHVHHHSALST